MLLAATSFACAPQRIDAVSCETGGCPEAAAGAASGGGFGGSGGSAGTASAGNPAVGRDSLIHRYGFDASPNGVEVVDSVQGSNGALVGAVYGTDDAAGAVLLAGKDSDQYVDLPNHLLDGLTDVTLEAWVSWAGGAIWQRVFDFGEDETGIDGSRSGLPRSYIFLSFNPRPRFAFAQPLAPRSEIVMNGPTAIPTGVPVHVAVVINETEQLASLFVDGSEVSSIPFSGSLSAVYDVNNWLGRSQYSADAGFEGSFSEFRIYAAALSAKELAASFDAGPDGYLEQVTESHTQ